MRLSSKKGGLTSEQFTAQKPSKLHPLVVLQPGERIICEIKRHPFGILSVYFAAAMALVAIFALVILAPTFFEQYIYDSNLNTMLTAGAILFTVIIGLIVVVATIVYWQNRWIVTDDSITQLTQISLFNRQVSQLSMENLENVTVDQHGIIQTLFNFGTLKAETAGEHTSFTFPYCPTPNKYAKLILEVHETFLHQRRHQPQPVYPISPINGPHSGMAQQYPQTYQQPMYQTPQSAQQQPMQSQPPQQPAQTSQYPQPPIPSQPQGPEPNSRGTTLPPPLQ